MTVSLNKEYGTGKSSRQKYNIVYFIDGLGMGGAENLLVPILKDLREHDFEPHVCAFQMRNGNPVAEEIRSLGIPVDLVEVSYLRDITAVPRLYRYLKDTRADLVHTQLEFADSLGNIAAKLRRLPSVSTLHTMPSQHDLDLRGRLHQEVEFLSLRYFCDLVISVSDKARQFHLDVSRLPQVRIRALYNGIDLSSFENLDVPSERANVRQELGIPLDATVFTTVAVLRELKGIQFMIRALPSILAAYPNVYYLIAGDGDFRDELAAEAKNAGVEERVVFAGMRKDVPCILAASDVFVLPTLTEALPTVLAEAMAARLPIVASAVGGVPEMVSDGHNGYLVPPADLNALTTACVALLNNPEKRREMGRNGWQVVNEKFNVRRQVEQLRDIYLGLIGKYAE